LEGIPYINLHRYDAVNGRSIEVKDRSPVHGVNYLVTLEDLQKYLIEYVEMPIPEALYPEKETKREAEIVTSPQETSLPESSPATLLRGKAPMPFPVLYLDTSWKVKTF
jgi:hypothetical protein